jgi:hypothetical protein
MKTQEASKVELDKSKKENNIFQLFTEKKFGNLFGYLSDFFSYNEKIIYSGINKSINRFIKEKYNLTCIALLNKTYIDKNDYNLFKNITWEKIESIISEILNKEKDVEYKVLLRHYAYLILTNKFSEKIILSNLKIDSLVLCFFDFFKEFNFPEKLNTVQIFKINLDNRIFDAMLKNVILYPKLSKKISILEINNVHLDENSINIIMDFILDKCILEKLNLSSTQIGKSNISLELLKILEKIDVIILNKNLYSSECIPYLVTLATIKKTGYIQIYENSFTQNDIKKIVSNISKKANIYLYINILGGPSYAISTSFWLVYNKNTSDQNFYYDYLFDFNFIGLQLHLNQITDVDIENINRVLQLPSLRSLDINFQNIPQLFYSVILSQIENLKIENFIICYSKSNTSNSILLNLLQLLPKNNSIKFLKINDINISEEIFIALLDLLMLSKLNELVIESVSGLDRKKIIVMINILKLNRSLTSLSIKDCQSINEKCMEFMKNSLKDHPSIKTLYIISY